GRILLALDEEVAHARGADADEHLDEVGAADGEERNPRLTGDGPRQQGLPRARRADDQNPFGDASAEARKLLRVLEEGDDLLDLVLGFLDPGHVVERDLVLVLVEELGAALTEGHRLAAANLHLAHEEDPHADEEEHREPLYEENDVPRVPVLGLGGDLDVL